MTTKTRPPGPLPTKSQLLNVLRRGSSYLAKTIDGRWAVGEYLGIEVHHGDRAILLSHRGVTESIAIDHLTSVHPHTG